MTRINWHGDNQRLYDLGVDRGVLYPVNKAGMVWDGLTSVNDSTSDIDSSVIYMDGQRFKNQLTFGNYSANVECFTYPSILDSSVGPFDFCYRTLIGDRDSEIGYKLHLVYNAIFTSDNKDYSTFNTNIEVTKFTWSISTTPSQIPNYRPTSHFIVDSTKVYSGIMEELELILYGDDLVDPVMPTIPQLLEFFEANAILKITNHGDGTWTAEGPDDVVNFIDSTTFEIDWPSVEYIDEDTYSVRSL